MHFLPRPALSSSLSCPSSSLVMLDLLFLVMPDPDRASNFSPRHARPSSPSCHPSSSSCPTFSYVMPDPDRASNFSTRHARPDRASHFSTRHARPSHCHARPRSGISILPVKRLPVKPAMTIWCHALPSSLVMPDSDRASLPHQIAGQAGNDDSTMQ